MVLRLFLTLAAIAIAIAACRWDGRLDPRLHRMVHPLDGRALHNFMHEDWRWIEKRTRPEQ